jgi:tetratricopeptide (TPR) repeat protein
MKRWATFALAAIVVAGMAHAGTAPQSAWDLYAAGRYADAIKAGTAAATAPGYLVAARAALADATTRPTPCLDCLRRAEDFARKATAADPKLADAHVYLAVAMGYEARVVGPVWARAHNYPGKAKDELDAALRLDPKSPWALGALGGWNVEIVRTGGDYLANWLYSASVDQGLASFAAAFKASPDNLSVRYQYALSLSGYDADRFSREIHDAFARIAKEKPATAYEALSRTRAAELAMLLSKGDREAFNARVRLYQGYP